jgi:DNA-binding beta-propeller fold protein YncE
MNEYLFPCRLTRRDFLKLGASASAGLAFTGLANAAEESAPVKIGSGHFTYTLDRSWGRLPAGMSFGLGCGVVVDSKDRVYVTTRSANPCVAIFDREGNLLETWSKDFGDKIGYTPQQIAETAHCVYWSKEGNAEFLYFTENAGGALGKRVYKTDLTGRVLYTIGNVEKEGPTSQAFKDWTNPTDVAVAPNGDIYVVDGYGSQRVSRFDKNFKHLKTIGSMGTAHGQFSTCHGIWVNTLRTGEPEIYIADRSNARYEIYSLELEYKRTLAGAHIRNPCCFYQHDGHLYIPDLASLVTIIDAKDELTAMLGDGRSLGLGMNASQDAATKNPDKFFAPHALTVDSQGSIYVVEWVGFGNVRKFKHTPA